MKLTNFETEVLDYIKANGRVSINEIAEAVGRSTKSVRPNITAMEKGKKAGLLVTEKVAVDGEEKPVLFVDATEAGKTFVPSEDEE